MRIAAAGDPVWGRPVPAPTVRLPGSGGRAMLRWTCCFGETHLGAIRSGCR
jgi:hypothetical protein